MSNLGTMPAWGVVLLAYVGTGLWSLNVSLTSSKIIPNSDYVGLDQYARLFSTARWITSLENMLVFGVGYIAGCIALGSLLAVLIDQRVRFENVFRTIILLPYALSYIVSGLIWNWMMNPREGLQAAVRALGWDGFVFDIAVRPETAIYAVVLVGVWHSAGLVMVLVLAGLRAVDEDIWKATRIDGIPAWRTYVSVVLPMLRPTMITCVILLSMGVVKVYDLVVALTNGGPGISTEVPAKFIMDHLFTRQNIGLATAGSVVLLVIVALVLIPWIRSEHRKR